MYQVLIIFHMLVAILLVSLILLQQGKGAEAGAAFGGGASQTVFGSQGSSSFLSRSTAILATLFFVICLGLTYLATKTNKKELLLRHPQPVVNVTEGAPKAPVIPESPETKDIPAIPSTDKP